MTMIATINDAADGEGGTMKPGSRYWFGCVLEADGVVRYEISIPDHPALPALAAWLQAHFDDDKVSAVQASLEGLGLWIDGLRDNGTHIDMMDAKGLEQAKDVIVDLLAALTPDAPETEGD
jgi:hypothetical protein